MILGIFIGVLLWQFFTLIVYFTTKQCEEKTLAFGIGIWGLLLWGIVNMYDIIKHSIKVRKAEEEMEKIEITREAWKEIKHVLAKYKIPFGVHYEERFPMEHLEIYDKSVWDVEVQIHEKLLIRDYYDEWSSK